MNEDIRIVTVDANNVAWTVPHLKKFLLGVARELLQKSGAAVFAEPERPRNAEPPPRRVRLYPAIDIRGGRAVRLLRWRRAGAPGAALLAILAVIPLIAGIQLFRRRDIPA